jgi:Ser/Thr protein kinase RdoA (MazF antagonist)
MDKHIRDQYDDQAMHQLAQRHDVGASEATLLDGFESSVYEDERDGQAYALRISHSSHRTAAQIQGEVEWINHLAGRRSWDSLRVSHSLRRAHGAKRAPHPTSGSREPRRYAPFWIVAPSGSPSAKRDSSSTMIHPS